MKILKFLGKFLSCILSLVISFICIFMIVYLAINMFINTNNLNKFINDKNILTIRYEDSTLKDDLITSFEDIGISKSDSEEIIESNEFNDLFGDEDDIFGNKSVEYFQEKWDELVNKYDIQLQM